MNRLLVGKQQEASVQTATVAVLIMLKRCSLSNCLSTSHFSHECGEQQEQYQLIASKGEKHVTADPELGKNCSKAHG